MDESDVLRIKITASDSELADAKPLVADRCILAGWSSCVRGLPLDATEWDLSNLIVEGRAVERSTVVAWLNIIYKAVKAEAFESQEPDFMCTLRGMGQLLGFADAVGSSRGLLVALDSHLAAAVSDNQVLTAEVRLGEHAVALRLTDCYQSIVADPYNSTLELGTICVHLGSLPFVGSSSDSIAECRRQVSSGMEVLLFHTFKQQLPRLTDIATNFIKQNSYALGNEYLLFSSEAVAAVFSGRVLEAVFLHNNPLQDHVTHCILQTPGKQCQYTE